MYFLCIMPIAVWGSTRLVCSVYNSNFSQHCVTLDQLQTLYTATCCSAVLQIDHTHLRRLSFLFVIAVSIPALGSCPLGTGVKRPEREADNLSSSNTEEVKNMWSYSSTSACYLVKRRNNLTFTYTYSIAATVQ